MLIPNFEQKVGTHNNKWPYSVTVLQSDQSVNGHPSDPSTDPNTLMAWIDYEFRKENNETNWSAQSDWWTAYLAILRWTENNQDTFIKLTHPINYTKFAHWNNRIKLLFNTTWAYFGYINNQSPHALSIAEYLHSPEGIEQLNASRGPIYPATKNTYGSWVDDNYPQKSKAKSYGKKASKTKVPQPPPRGKPFILPTGPKVTSRA